MKGIKRIFKRINVHDFTTYLFLSILLLVTLVTIRSFEFTQARYESDVDMEIEPNLAFFIVDVGTTSGTIKLTGMVPRDDPYEYRFNVSNFRDGRRANVDLTYSIEIITTTNMPLTFKIFKGNGSTLDEIDSDTTTTDGNGVYYRHLVINDVSQMPFNADTTDLYTLWVSFPKTYVRPVNEGGNIGVINNPEAYAGIIDLVDIKINAEQVV